MILNVCDVLATSVLIIPPHILCTSPRPRHDAVELSNGTVGYPYLASLKIAAGSVAQLELLGGQVAIDAANSVRCTIAEEHCECSPTHSAEMKLPLFFLTKDDRHWRVYRQF